MLRRITLAILSLIFITGCGVSQPAVETELKTQPTTTATTEMPTEATTIPTEETQVVAFDPYAIIDSMSVEALVGQLFLGSCPGKSNAIQAILDYQPGGFVLFGSDVKEETPTSLRLTLDTYQNASQIPMLFAIDEEGGTVVRVSQYSQYRQEPFSSHRNLYNQGGIDAVLTTESEKCQLLRSLGINVNLGPVCDITTDANAFVYRRSLGLPPQDTADVVTVVVQAMSSSGIGSALKHFPGYGNNADTHIGTALDQRSLQELLENDLVPFAAGIAAGCDAIMISHTIISAIDETLPASLSPAVHTFLREEMGFNGILMTDDLIMDAISDVYGDAEAAVLAVLAGNDILCTGAFQEQYPAVLEAVESGRISIDTVKESVARILLWKYKLGLIV